MATTVTDWLVFIGGYMQDRSLATYGICGMAHEAWGRYADRDVCVSYEPWTSDWKSTAEWIFRWSGYDSAKPNGVAEPPRIMVVAYSWGAGWGLCQLAEHLSVRGLTIRHAIASDAVRHVGWKWCHSLGIAQVCAYMPWLTIERPEGIERLDWFVQNRRRRILNDYMNGVSLLRGHQWVDGAGNPAGNCYEVPYASHTNMDDSSAFRRHVFEMADQMFLGPA